MKPSLSKTSTATPSWIGGFLAGVVIKSSMLSYMGVFDMDAYIEWGRKALQSGLVNYYHGTYFPLQYQIFEFCVWIAARLGSELVFILKTSNLLFDTAAFSLLLVLLKRQESNPAYALLYWLHPWFLSVFSLGYIDFQFTSLVLLCLYWLRDDTAKDYLLSGSALGLAFVMKPQALILVVAAFCYAACHYARTRDMRAVAIMAGPVAFFLGYEIFFTVSLFSKLRYWAAYVIPLSYLNITDVFPCLTGQMTNMWYPVAYVLKKPGDPIYSISDRIFILPHVPAKWMAAAIVLGIVAFHAFRVERDPQMTLGGKFIQMFGLASLAVPFIMTSAHENHLFLGSVFLVLFLGKNYPFSFKFAAHVLLVIQFLNIYGLYGEHPVWIAQLLRSTYSEKLAVFYSLAGVACFALILKYLFGRESRDY